MSLVISKVFTYDTDAGNYIQAVEAADTVALEPAVRQAINNFVIGCKQDGIWSAIKASCILAGARKKEGAFIDLKTGTQILTNNGFADGDYNRKTGLVGNGSTKYLDSNRADNADPQDNAHLSVYVSQAGSGAAGSFHSYAAGGGVTTTASLRAIIRINQVGGLTGLSQYSRQGDFSGNININSVGFFGNSRSASGSFIRRDLGASSTILATSLVPYNTTIGIFAELRNGALFGRHTDARIAFYSIGESLDLALLDARVTALINAFGAAIP